MKSWNCFATPQIGYHYKSQQKTLNPVCHPWVFHESHVCLTVASKTIFFVWALDSPVFSWKEYKKNLDIWGRYTLNPYHDFIMTACSRSRLVVNELFRPAGGFRTKTILLRKLEQAWVKLNFSTALHDFGGNDHLSLLTRDYNFTINPSVKNIC